MKKIVTPMNFVRGCEPRLEMDLLTTTKKQIELTNRYGIKTTYLLQYDAFVQEEYQELFIPKNDLIEVGLWFEIVQEMVERVGLKWRGREGYSWDYFNHVAMPIAYTDSEKKLLIDETFARYREVFGCYPKTVGAWLLDPYTIAYIKEKYDVVTCCICREQWGTDGTTLFGGYYNQAYYPSKNNILCPSDKRNGVPVPVFRLLGCDPIYQYDRQLISTSGDVFTLEPVYWPDWVTGENAKIGGSYSPWVTWYFDSLYKHDYGLSLAYSQVGQENSFGWERIHGGLIDQLNQIKPMIDDGTVEAMFLREAGEWFSNTYEKSPPSTQVALQDHEGQNIQSIWFYCINYRVNLYVDENGARIRDMHIYDERYEGRYKNNVCVTPESIHENLPIMNGLVWSTREDRAGIYFCDTDGNRLKPTAVEYDEKDQTSVTTVYFDDLTAKIRLQEDEIELSLSEGICLQFHYVAFHDDEEFIIKDERTLFGKKRNFVYSLTLDQGKIANKQVLPTDGVIRVKFAK